MQPIVHHGGNDAAGHPCGDQQPNRHDDQQGGDGRFNGIRDPVEHFSPRIVVHKADDRRRGRRNQQWDMGRTAQQRRHGDDECEQQDENGHSRPESDRPRSMLSSADFPSLHVI